MNPNVEKISKVIKNLEHLEKRAKYYREHWPTGEINHLGLNTGADNYWSQNVQPLVETIDLDIDELWDYIISFTRSEDNYGWLSPPTGPVALRRNIKYVINSRKPTCVHALIQHLKKIQRRLEIKTQPAGTGHESEPDGLDEIDNKIIALYQEAEKQNQKLPGSRKIAKALYNSGITQKKYSHEGINKRIRKLRQQGLISNPDDNAGPAQRHTNENIADLGGEGKIKQKF